MCDFVNRFWVQKHIIFNESTFYVIYDKYRREEFIDVIFKDIQLKNCPMENKSGENSNFLAIIVKFGFEYYSYCKRKLNRVFLCFLRVSLQFS